MKPSGARLRHLAAAARPLRGVGRAWAGVLLVVALGACSQEPTATAPTADGAGPATVGAAGETVTAAAPRIVATTTLVGDIVARVGGDAVDLFVLLPTGADPHGFEAAPRDVAAVADADIVFTNGLGLEVFLDALLENAGGGTRVVPVSEGITTITLGGPTGAGEGDGHAGEADRGHTTGDVDPHVWLDPANVSVWADNVYAALGEIDPGHAEAYAANAAALRAELADLDAWILAQVAAIPEDRRVLVADHRTLGYFAERYGFTQAGAVVPGLSSLAEPSAAELAALEDTIVVLGVPAVFVSSTANPNLAERVADDTGTHVVRLYTGSLSAPGGPAGSYDALMRHNVSAIVEALR